MTDSNCQKKHSTCVNINTCLQPILRLSMTLVMIGKA